MSIPAVDAVVVGAGPNGLVAANLLADAGWDVLVLEGADEPGGAVRSAELTLPGYTHDLFSAFYPLAVASPVIGDLELEKHGLEWRRAPVAVAHPRSDGTCPYIASDPVETSRSLEHLGADDARAWERLFELWRRCGKHVIDALLSPFPPLAPGARLLAALGPHDSLRLARLSVLPLRRLMDEENAPHLALLLAGNALHADLTPEVPLGTFFGWLLCSLGQEVGFPVPAGGAGRLTDALVARLRSHGGDVECGRWVTRVEVEAGVARGVVCDDGSRVRARRAVLADVTAPALYRDLVGLDRVPERTREDLAHFHLDDATFKVDWALRGEIPWTAEPARRAGTIHLADDLDELSEVGLHLSRRAIPAKPYLVLGQMNVADPSRSTPGTHTVWAYTHVPQKARGDAAGELKGTWDDHDSELFADRIEDVVEALAPGFRSRIVARHLLPPPRFEALNPSLPSGALNGGTAQLHQQLVFRPLPGTAGPRTPIRRLYLASSSAHPGGGVHGAPGANAAKAALFAARLRRRAAVGASVLVGRALAGRRRAGKRRR